jgi:polyphosphate kinase 2
VDGILVTGGTGFTGRDSTPEALRPLLDKEMPGFGEMFRVLSFEEIGTSTLQSRAFAGLANATFVFCLPGSTSACRTAWEKLIRAQLDARTRPCNLANLRPRLREAEERKGGRRARGLLKRPGPPFSVLSLWSHPRLDLRGVDCGLLPAGPAAMKRKEFEKHYEKLEVELNEMARWMVHTGKRALVIFEGRDTAGKGGAIEAIRGCLPPRQCRAVALSKPTERESTQWYFQRYIQHLPAAGELVLFDRSWYNRAGVEKVMGFATDAQVRDFLRQVLWLEKLLVDDGLMLFKYWLAVDQDQQEERFAERLKDPVKRWKLSPIDVKAREKYADYGKARDAMFAVTHTAHAPWTVVDFNDQKRGRLDLIRDLLDRLPDHKIPEKTIAFPKLKGKPSKERYTSEVKPIKTKFK